MGASHRFQGAFLLHQVSRPHPNLNQAIQFNIQYLSNSHLNKTTTYEAPECIRWDEHPPEPRLVQLQRSASLGFGFVAGSERPVIVRFVTEGGPSIGKLQPGDQILAVNGEDVKDAPRDHVIQLVRACEAQVSLLVCQPMAHCVLPGRKSTLLSAGKRAKLRTRPSRVRFAESVCVNGAPLFPVGAAIGRLTRLIFNCFSRFSLTTAVSFLAGRYLCAAHGECAQGVSGEWSDQVIQV